MFSLSPAYGRDYKSRKALLEDFYAGKDFINSTIGTSGRYVSKSELPAGSRVQFRYKRMTQTFIHEVNGDDV
jgi:hypothetical protein